MTSPRILRRIRSHLVFAALMMPMCTAVGQPVEDRLRENVETLLAEEGLTGIAWSLVEDGDVQLGAAGLRDNLSGAAFDVNTRFHVGSITKSLLATGVLRLATEGRIDIDAPAVRYLPGYRFDSHRGGVADVTVRQLLDHTAGLNDAQLWQMFSERAEADAPLASAFPNPDLLLRLRSRPGSRFSYSNSGYALLGIIIESVAGERYEAYLDTALLAPLSMHDSTFAYTTQDGEEADATLAWGHVDDGSRYAASPIFLRPAGQFTTTAADMARLARFLMSDGKIDGDVFIDEALMRARGVATGTEASEAGLVAGYALGLGRRDRHGVVGFCHGGNIVGFSAMLCIFPGEQKAFAYSVNTDSETADYGRLEALFKQALNVAEAAPPRNASPANDIAEWYGRYRFSPNRFRMFEYLDNVFGAIKVSPGADTLVVSSLQRSDRLLRPVAGGNGRLYSAADRTTASHVFLRGDGGAYLLSDGFQTYEKISSAYLVAHWISIALGLAGLAYVLLAGLVSLVRHRGRIARRPEAPAFLAALGLIAPIPFFFGQSFMALGDLTLASALLATATLLLPLGMLWTIRRAWKTWAKSGKSKVVGLAAALVLQWCGVLAASGMLPFRLWA